MGLDKPTETRIMDGNMEPKFKPIKKLFRCPYCEFVYEDEEKAVACHGICSTADLLEQDFFYDSKDVKDKWTPPPVQEFHKWNRGDRAEFVRRLEMFFQKHYR